MEKIGIVGTGAMGTALLSPLKLAGGAATAFDIAPQAAEQARAEGAEILPSAKAVAQVSTMIDVSMCGPTRTFSTACSVLTELWKERRREHWSCCTAQSARPQLKKSPKPQPTSASTSSMPA